MGLIDRIFKRPAQESIHTSRLIPATGRVTMNTSGKIPFGVRSENKPDGGRTQTYIDLDIKSLTKLAVKDLHDVLIDSDAEVSLALYHFIRFCNSGHHFDLHHSGTDRVHVEATAILDEFMGDLEGYYGGFDILLTKMFYSIFEGGAVFVEILLDNNGTDMVDFIVVSPHEARFRKKTDPVRGEVWELGQIKDKEFFSLADYDTVVYMPFDPAVGSPYGRSIISPTVFSSLFLISILKDLERVIRHQGWKRLDIVLETEKIKIPTNDPKEVKKVIDGWIDDICARYQALDPDEVFVHSDHFKFETPVGTTDRSNLSGIEDIIRVLERRIIRGIKSQPILMGSNESVAETHASRQWEIYAAAIRGVQSLVARSIENLLHVAFLAQGIQVDVGLMFDEFRDSERLRDAQAEQLELINLEHKVDKKYIEQADAKEIAMGRSRRQPRRRNPQNEHRVDTGEGDPTAD